ncbi:hypothetical protein RSOL_362070 [Rhizoctonia solani AG-3 Rhs1AP]|uniref:Uncharacterized protein n=1 Tax=Rhizoctonia solani AG-3 Rhs1AP TaxID=1086054 RepID=X8JBT7_9AGAM|nr:hypothetical protein RSOL_362070 [Rhizoctonia solani AG-3 Rhs1AP]
MTRLGKRYCRLPPVLRFLPYSEFRILKKWLALLRQCKAHRCLPRSMSLQMCAGTAMDSG